jgi:LytS/YehU family sensor histidine kinase
MLILLGNVLSAAALAVIIGLLSDASPRFLLVGFTISIVFALCNGSLMFLVLPAVAPRYARRPPPWNWVLYLLTITGLTLIGTFIATGILIWIGIFSSKLLWAQYRTALVIALVIGFVIGIGKFIYEGLKHRLETTTRKLQVKELEEERARKLAIEARLSSLESRIHPHFLFNTLNSISSLIQEDPKLAERLLERLAALLRFSLDSNQRSTVPLEQELKIVVDYLEIEKARFGEKLSYSIDAPPDLQTAEVPPLSIQTLVENGIKHGLSRKRGAGRLQVSIRRTDDRLELEVVDDGPGFDGNGHVEGHGLDNLRARLTALFDERAGVEIGRRGDETVVSITLPCTAARAGGEV